ncbi:MAG TPA: type II toxin-antitoxin system VapC family toxin [Kiritimatiellia bacterium]|nr:type II toxin-antitoxin system VapC family toxin [Kiritimatiellia bacterium]
MRALFDTNVLLWWLSDPKRIPEALMTQLKDDQSILYYSQISLLEIQFKLNLGKLDLSFPPNNLPELAEKSGLIEWPLTNQAIFTLAKLPSIHRDPFDRLLIAESIQGGLALITPDETIHRYPVKARWT